jgi:hypothetical protein
MVRKGNKVDDSKALSHEEKLAKHFSAGMAEGAKWALSAEFEAFKEAVERRTINEVIRHLNSDGLMPLANLTDEAPEQIHTSSPMLAGDFPSMSDLLNEVFAQGEGYGYEIEREVGGYRFYVNIPNGYFRSYEDGWTKAVRQKWEALHSTGAGSQKMPS